MRIFTIAVRNIIKNGSFLLSYFLFENPKVLTCNVQYLRCLLVKHDCLSIRSLLHLIDCPILASLYFFFDFVKLRLQFLPLSLEFFLLLRGLRGCLLGFYLLSLFLFLQFFLLLLFVPLAQLLHVLLPVFFFLDQLFVELFLE